MSVALLVLVACCCCSSSSVGAYFALNKNAKYYEDKVDPSYVPEITYEDLSENAKNLISAIEKIYDGISPEKCTDLKEKWDKIIDGRSLDEIFERGEVKDPELYFIFSNPKYRGVLEIVSEINELIALRDDTSELPEGVTMVEMSDEEIINKFCISDLKRKIDEKVTLLKNEDISGCDLYDDTWHVIRKDWNNGLIWDNENNKILVAHNYVSKALGETNEDLKAGKRMVKETLCAPPSSPSPSQNIIDHGNGYI